MKAVEWFNVVLICLVISMGLIIRDLQPVVEDPYVVDDPYVTINSPMGEYKLSKDSIYQEVKIDDEFGISYYIKFQSVEGTTVVEFRDTEGITAIENKDSFLMALYGEYL